VDDDPPNGRTVDDDELLEEEALVDDLSELAAFGAELCSGS
jgi:hypothetical protein